MSGKTSATRIKLSSIPRHPRIQSVSSEELGFTLRLDQELGVGQAAVNADAFRHGLENHSLHDAVRAFTCSLLAPRCLKDPKNCQGNMSQRMRTTICQATARISDNLGTCSSRIANAQRFSAKAIAFAIAGLSASCQEELNNLEVSPATPQEAPTTPKPPRPKNFCEANQVPMSCDGSTFPAELCANCQDIAWNSKPTHVVDFGT